MNPGPNLSKTTGILPSSFRSDAAKDTVSAEVLGPGTISTSGMM